jgi:hypothetical protein
VLVVDADATLVLSHSDAKQGAAGTYKHTFGFAPLLAYLDRGQAPGEPLAGLLRPGNAAAGAAGDLIELVDLALAQLPAADLPVLVRSDSAGASTRLAWHLRDRGVGFSLGMPIDAHVREAILAQPEPAWAGAVDADGQVRDGAEVCELTGFIDLHTWPEGTRASCRREDAHPGAQLRFSDHDGHRFQVFLTDQPDPDLAGLELRHRQRARVEDRIRAAKATGLRNLPFDLLRRNAVWLELVLCAQDLTCWAQAVLLDGALAVAEPKALRTGCSTWPQGWCATPAASCCACKPPGPGRSSSPGRSPGCEPYRCAADAARCRCCGWSGARPDRRARDAPRRRPDPIPEDPDHAQSDNPAAINGERAGLGPLAGPQPTPPAPHEKPRLVPS